MTKPACSSRMHGFDDKIALRGGTLIFKRDINAGTDAMGKKPYLGMKEGDLDGKPYAKYWNPVMQPLQPQVQQALLHGLEAPELGFFMEQADLLAEPGYLPLENGRTILANGQIFVAVLTHMPRVTGAMLYWWAGWHYMEPQRYKLWHPRAHVTNGTREMRGDDPSVSDRDKYMTTHYATEYIGNRCEDITITFVPPETYFSNTSGFSDKGITATICGKVGLQRAPINIGYLIHQIRETQDRAEMRSRFWLAKPELNGVRKESWINKILGSKFFTSRVLPGDIGRDMVVHCGMEMNHLAGFLPDLYRDYHPEMEVV